MHFAELPAAIQARQVDALVIDQFHMAGGAVADHLQLPYVHAAMAMIFIAENGVPPVNLDWGPERHPWARFRNAMAYALVRKMLKPVHSKINAQRVAWGLALHARFPNDVFVGHPQISQQPPSFEFPRRNCRLSFILSVRCIVERLDRKRSFRGSGSMGARYSTLPWALCRMGWIGFFA